MACYPVRTDNAQEVFRLIGFDLHLDKIAVTRNTIHGRSTDINKKAQDTPHAYD
jgi:hypothetical protein